MRKAEFVFRELLFQVLEKKQYSFTQKDLSSRLGISLSNVNHALLRLRAMNAVKVKPMGCSVVNAKKILFYWACSRNLQEDIVYSTRAEIPVREIEKNMPADAIFTAYSGFKFKFNDAPADYSEVYVYAADLDEMRKRFPHSAKQPNLFVLQCDAIMQGHGNIAPIGQLFADLWNLPEWYARDFLKALEAKIDALLE
jgi:hypothetical protein